MLPCKCPACGRSGLPRDPRTNAGNAVAHVREDRPDTLGLPCLRQHQGIPPVLPLQQALFAEMDLDA